MENPKQNTDSSNAAQNPSGERADSPSPAPERCAVVERAFIAYVNDEQERYCTAQGLPMETPVLGLCDECAFPIYRSQYGERELFHYSPQRYHSRPLVCAEPKLNAPERDAEN